MAKLEPIEKQMIATALLAMYFECPADEQEGVAVIIAKITSALDLRDAFQSVLELSKAAAEASGGGKVE